MGTSTVIQLPRLRAPEALPEQPLITAITLAELSVGPLVTEQTRALSRHRLIRCLGPLPLERRQEIARRLRLIAHQV
ncbi:hypothetical protein ACVU7I_03030 [Patulibacter sp. S7RM1-6]